MKNSNLQKSSGNSSGVRKVFSDGRPSVRPEHYVFPDGTGRPGFGSSNPESGNRISGRANAQHNFMPTQTQTKLQTKGRTTLLTRGPIKVRVSPAGGRDFHVSQQGEIIASLPEHSAIAYARRFIARQKMPSKNDQ
jgi:hypothetical protein